MIYFNVYSIFAQWALGVSGPTCFDAYSCCNSTFNLTVCRHPSDRNTPGFTSVVYVFTTHFLFFICSLKLHQFVQHHRTVPLPLHTDCSWPAVFSATLAFISDFDSERGRQEICGDRKVVNATNVLWRAFLIHLSYSAFSILSFCDDPLPLQAFLS